MKTASPRPKKPSGRPRLNDDEIVAVVPVRIPSETLNRVLAWGDAQSPPLPRSKALRALIEQALRTS